MGGLTGVGTYPEYSNMGLMHKLLEQALKNMKERGQDICYLYPYSIPYYRRKGWEIISDKISYEIKDYQLPKNHQVPGDVRRVDTEGEELKEAYNRYAMRTHGAILRDDLAWNEYWLWDSDDIMAAVYYNGNNEPDGYVIYWIAKEVFHIKDMIFNNEEARTGLWNFVAAHFSMINQVEGDTYTDEPLAFLLEDASIREVISPYYMGRIVDFVSFIEKYPFKPSVLDREWKFKLIDPVMECNQGNFCLTISREGKGQAVRTMEPCQDEISIQTMTTMLMGYKRPEYLARIGRIKAAEWTIDMLEDAIEQQTPYIYLWMIDVIFRIRSIRAAEFFLLAGILLIGVSILCSSAINRKRWITSWMISFCACFIYLICYILAGYAGLVIPMGEILEADPNPANGILLMLYTAVFWGVAVVTRVISGIFYSVLNRFGSSKMNTYL